MSKTEDLLEKLAITIVRDGERWRDEYRAGMSLFAAGVRLEAARPLVLNGSSQLLWGGPSRLVGWSVRATAGPATLNLRNGRDNTADLVATVTLTAAGSTETKWLAPGGVSVTEALWIEYASGTITGTVYIGAVD